MRWIEERRELLLGVAIALGLTVLFAFVLSLLTSEPAVDTRAPLSTDPYTVGEQYGRTLRRQGLSSSEAYYACADRSDALREATGTFQFSCQRGYAVEGD